MTSFVDFNSTVQNLNNLMKWVLELNEAEKRARSGELRGRGDVNQIDEPESKGYLIQRRLWLNQPREPLDPIEPFDPWKRRPMPQRPFRSPETWNGPHEALTDVFEDDAAVRIYVEVPGVAKDDIQLNVTENQVEVKARNLYQMIAVPGPIEVEKASSQYNNGVLTILLPQKARSHEMETQRIQIE